MILNYLLIPIVGYVVAGYTTLFAYIVFAVANYLFMRKICKENGEGSIYDMKFLTFFGIFMIGATVLITLTYNSFWLRAGLVVVIMIVAAIFYKKIIALLKSFKNKA